MEEHDLYPPKPELVEHKPKSSWSLTVFSIVLFILVFLLLFEFEFRSSRFTCGCCRNCELGNDEFHPFADLQASEVSLSSSKVSSTTGTCR